MNFCTLLEEIIKKRNNENEEGVSFPLFSLLTNSPSEPKSMESEILREAVRHRVNRNSYTEQLNKAIMNMGTSRQKLKLKEVIHLYEFKINNMISDFIKQAKGAEEVSVSDQTTPSTSPSDGSCSRVTPMAYTLTDALFKYTHAPTNQMFHANGRGFIERLDLIRPDDEWGDAYDGEESYSHIKSVLDNVKVKNQTYKTTLFRSVLLLRKIFEIVPHIVHYYYLSLPVFFSQRDNPYETVYSEFDLSSESTKFNHSLRALYEGNGINNEAAAVFYTLFTLVITKYPLDFSCGGESVSDLITYQDMIKNSPSLMTVYNLPRNRDNSCYCDSILVVMYLTSEFFDDTLFIKKIVPDDESGNLLINSNLHSWKHLSDFIAMSKFDKKLFYSVPDVPREVILLEDGQVSSNYINNELFKMIDLNSISPSRQAKESDGQNLYKIEKIFGNFTGSPDSSGGIVVPKSAVDVSLKLREVVKLIRQNRQNVDNSDTSKRSDIVRETVRKLRVALSEHKSSIRSVTSQEDSVEFLSNLMSLTGAGDKHFIKVLSSKKFTYYHSSTKKILSYTNSASSVRSASVDNDILDIKLIWIIRSYYYAHYGVEKGKFTEIDDHKELLDFLYHGKKPTLTIQRIIDTTIGFDTALPICDYITPVPDSSEHVAFKNFIEENRRNVDSGIGVTSSLSDYSSVIYETRLVLYVPPVFYITVTRDDEGRRVNIDFDTLDKDITILTIYGKLTYVVVGIVMHLGYHYVSVFKPDENKDIWVNYDDTAVEHDVTSWKDINQRTKAQIKTDSTILFLKRKSM